MKESDLGALPRGVVPLADVTQTLGKLRSLPKSVSSPSLIHARQTIHPASSAKTRIITQKGLRALLCEEKGVSCAKSCAIAPMSLPPSETEECVLVILDEDGGQTETTTTVITTEVNIDEESEDENQDNPSYSANSREHRYI